MNAEQADTMKKDVCAAIDKLYEITKDLAPFEASASSGELSPTEVKQLAAASASMMMARFCAAMHDLSDGGEDALHTLIEVEMAYRVARGMSIAEDDEDDPFVSNPERN